MYMAEDISRNNIEAEIAELSQKIAEKRSQLEASKGIISERELVKSALGERISNTVPKNTGTSSTSTVAVATSSGTATPPPAGKSYLDFIDEESRLEIEKLVSTVFEKGLDNTLKSLEYETPFIIDAFHDVLTDKLYGELKKRGILKN